MTTPTFPGIDFAKDMAPGAAMGQITHVLRVIGVTETEIQGYIEDFLKAKGEDDDRVCVRWNIEVR